MSTSTPRRQGRGRLRAGVAALTILATGLALTACGSGKSADGSAPKSAVPSQDVTGAVRPVAALIATLPADVKSSKKITLGTTEVTGTQGLPHAGVVDGKTVGLDIDLRAAIAKVLGITWDVQYGTFATIIPGVQNGRYQVGAANFGVTKKRLQIVDFATYLNDGQSFLGRKGLGLDKVSSLADICGYTVATSPGSTFQQELTDYAGKCAAAGKKPYNVQYFSDTAPIFLGLANGKTDIYFGPTLSVKYDAQHIAGTKFLGQVTTTPVGFTTAKGSPLAPALAGAVNALIASGVYQKIFAKWGVADTAIASSQVNPAATF